MQELAEKRTQIVKPDQIDSQSKNQQILAKIHQQDLDKSRISRKHGSVSAIDSPTEKESKIESKQPTEANDSENMNVTTEDKTDISQVNITGNSSIMDQTVTPSTADDSYSRSTHVPSKRPRYLFSKRGAGARKSNRQRTTRRYLTAAQASGGTKSAARINIDNSFGVSDFEETRHSFNATPDAKIIQDPRKRKSMPATTSMSSIDSPITADSGSSSFLPLQAFSSNEAENNTLTAADHQYVKEDGELIKIVTMRQEEVINCLCSYGEEDGLMIQCELCYCWQHGACYGIERETDVPEKYVCYICRHPERVRDSMRFKHDQDWMYEGKLPVANYHTPNPNLSKRFDLLQKTHVITGNLLEIKYYMHSLRVKMNIVNNRCHPKLYLWAKKWEDDAPIQHQNNIKSDIKEEIEIKEEVIGQPQSIQTVKPNDSFAMSPSKKLKLEENTETIATVPAVPNVPQPEAAIDPVECQHRLLEHIKTVQNKLINELDSIEAQIEELEDTDDLPDLKNAEMNSVKDVLQCCTKDLDVMLQIAKLNALENIKTNMKTQMKLKGNPI